MTGHRFQLLGALLVAGFVSFSPAIAAACSVCMTGREDDTRIAFELMTAFMTVMPFLLVGAVIWWIRGRVRELEAMHERARNSARNEHAAAGSAHRSVLPVETNSR